MELQQGILLKTVGKREYEPVKRSEDSRNQFLTDEWSIDGEISS